VDCPVLVEVDVEFELELGLELGVEEIVSVKKFVDCSVVFEVLSIELEFVNAMADYQSLPTRAKGQKTNAKQQLECLPKRRDRQRELSRTSTFSQDVHFETNV
jgi:hypothetical protein